MQKTVKTRSGRVVILPTEEEDAAINAGIAADPDAYELTEEDFKRMRPAREVLSEILGKDKTEALLKRRGRPTGTGSKEQITVRFDKEVLAAFKASGEGWQTRMNEALKDWLLTHQP